MELRRQPCAAFCAAALEDEAPRLRRHAGTETMGARALDFAGLVCAFHGLFPTGFSEGRQGYADGPGVSID